MPELETIDFTPSWGTTSQYLLLIIKYSTNLKDKAWAESEVVRMGRIIDTLQAQQTPNVSEPRNLNHYA